MNEYFWIFDGVEDLHVSSEPVTHHRAANDDK
jgi:hypothetical protein